MGESYYDGMKADAAAKQSALNKKAAAAKFHPDSVDKYVQVGSCTICGAIVTQSKWELHSNWHSRV